MRGTRATILVQNAFRQLMDATNETARNEAAEDLRLALKRLVREPMGDVPASVPPPTGDRELLRRVGKVLNTVPDKQLQDFNRLLPWGAITSDVRGRLIGQPWTTHKRTEVNAVIDKRLLEFDAIYPLEGKHVLEVGCFEGLHTLGAMLLKAKVTAIDSRIENVVKTLARLWIYGRRGEIILWDLEEPAPRTAPAEWDYLHHIGVLYHLTNPLEHLNEFLPKTREAVLLDTHIAQSPEHTTGAYPTGERFFLFDERPDDEPFAGMKDHAKWLLLEDLMDLFRSHGFQDLRITSDRQERNGRRITLFAGR